MSLLIRIADRCEINSEIIKSRVSIQNDKDIDNNENGKDKKEEMLLRQKNILNQFKSQQSQFLSNLTDEDMEDEEEGLLEEGQSFTCVLCRDSTSISQSLDENRPFGLTAFLQPSNLLRCSRDRESNENIDRDLLKVNINDESNQNLKSEDEKKKEKEEKKNTCNNISPLRKHFEDEILSDIETKTTNDIRFCGHHVHMDCLHRYFESLCQRCESRQDFEGRLIINLPSGEFLCPSCRRLCNCIIPVIPKQSIFSNFCSSKLPIINNDIDNNNINLNSNDIFNNIINNWKIPLNLLNEKSLLHEDEEENPAKYILEKNSSTTLSLPSSPVPPSNIKLISSNDIYSDGLDMFLQRACVKAGRWIGSQISGKYIYQFYNFPKLLQERLSSLELQSRMVLYSFKDFISTQQTEMQENELLLNICLSYRINEEFSNDYRKFLCKTLLNSFNINDTNDSNIYNIDVLNKDPFSFLILIVCSNAIPLDHIFIFELIRSIFLLQIIQSYCSIYKSIELDNLINIIQNISLVDNNSKNQELELLIHKLSVKFLKQATLLLVLLDPRLLNDIPLGLSMDINSNQIEKDFEQLCYLLRLPNNTLKFLKSENSLKLLSKWIKYNRINEINKKDEDIDNMEIDNDIIPSTCSSIINTRIVYEPKPFKFIALPNLFQDIFQHVVRQYCNVCEDLTPETGICLTCGKIICAGIKHLTLRGIVGNNQFSNSLNIFVSHAENCGGVFLVLRLCTVLLFRSRRISVWNSIYLDEHGEEDIELRRGKALYLEPSRVEQILKLVVSQTIDHETRVLAKTQILGRPR